MKFSKCIVFVSSQCWDSTASVIQKHEPGVLDVEITGYALLQNIKFY